jgi:hypothetical protein
MPSEPVPPDPGRDEDPRPVPPWPEWMDDPAYLALRAADEDPGDPDQDPEDAPPPDVDPGELAAEAERITADRARAAEVGLVLRSLCYTVTALRSAVTAAV